MINFNDQSALSIHSYWYTYTNYNITAIRDFILVAIRQNGWNDIIERKIYGEIIICARLLVKKKKKTINDRLLGGEIKKKKSTEERIMMFQEEFNGIVRIFLRQALCDGDGQISLSFFLPHSYFISRIIIWNHVAPLLSSAKTTKAI